MYTYMCMHVRICVYIHVPKLRVIIPRVLRDWSISKPCHAVNALVTLMRFVRYGSLLYPVDLSGFIEIGYFKSGNIFNILREIYALHTMITLNLKVLIPKMKVFYKRISAIWKNLPCFEIQLKERKNITIYYKRYHRFFMKNRTWIW